MSVLAIWLIEQKSSSKAGFRSELKTLFSFFCLLLCVLTHFEDECPKLNTLFGKPWIMA